jgi:DNA-binding MarR family transcriptional regulator|nr:MAG TPA: TRANSCRIPTIONAL REGULATOR SLYA, TRANSCRIPTION FACTOR, GLOBAL REGULATOR.85A [Caudoviricetes sp.]
MTNKEKFISFIQAEIFEKEDIYVENYGEDWEDIKNFWSQFLNDKKSPSNSGMTENGSKILKYMQSNENKYNNLFTSKEIGEGLFMSSRSVSGSMRKIIANGFVEKVGKDPVTYSLTDEGRNKQID